MTITREKYETFDNSVMSEFQRRYSAGEWRTIIFRDMILRDLGVHVGRTSILDIGCGSGFDDSIAIQKEIAASSNCFIGVEPDPNVKLGSHINHVYRSKFEDSDIPDSSIDLAFAVMVLEHIQSPSDFWRKVHSILCPGGIFWGFTMDRRHFFCTLSQLAERLRIKNQLLNCLRGKRGEGRYDNYPTYYLANDPRRLRQDTGAFSRCDTINLSKVGETDYYVPRSLTCVAHAFDRCWMRLNLPGSILCVRLQK